MHVYDAILTRRSVGKVKPDPVEKEKIDHILKSGTWAPSHHRTEPWQFFVLTGEGRKPLGRVMAEISREEMDDPQTEENQAKLKKIEQKPFRAPVIIAVAAIPASDPKVEPIEEKAAVSAAIQNMLLVAHSLCLGAIWRTGKATYHPKMKSLFGLREQDEILGFLYIGYPDRPKKKRTRIPYEEKTVWIAEDEPYA